jgi:hypothetical protein
MPISTCPHCRAEQTVPRDLLGLSVGCSGSGKEFVAKDGAGALKRRKERQVEGEPDPLDVKALARAAGLVAAIVAPVGLVVLGLAVFGGGKKDPAPGTAPAATARAVPNRVPAPLSTEREGGPDVNPALAAAGFAAVLTAGAVGLLGLAYFAAVLLTGGWIAKDAYRRGMNGLAWCVFYCVYQLVLRMVLCVVAAIPAMGAALLIPGIGLLLPMVFIEAACWCGLVVYLIGRRPGDLGRCRECDGRKLRYLPVCPHCSDGDPAFA